MGEVLYALRILLLLLTPCSKVQARLVLRNSLEVSGSKFEILRNWPSRTQAQDYTEISSFFSWYSNIFSTVSVLPLQEREVFHSGLQSIRLKICRILRSLEQMTNCQRSRENKDLQTWTERVARLFTDFTTISYVVWNVPLQPMNCTEYKGEVVPVNEWTNERKNE